VTVPSDFTLKCNTRGAEAPADTATEATEPTELTELTVARATRRVSGQGVNNLGCRTTRCASA